MANRTLVEVKERFLAKSADNRKLWDETERKRSIGAALAMFRGERGLSQTEVADRAGLNKTFVSGLEGADGGYPETATLARYVEACGGRLVVGVMDPDNAASGRARILDVLPPIQGSLPSPRPSSWVRSKPSSEPWCR